MAFISIDYDDTIVYQDFPNAGTIKPNAVKVINRLHEEGHQIMIWTCRVGERFDIAMNYLKEQGIKFHIANVNHPDIIAKFGEDTRKMFADIYIDDKQLGGIPDDWDVIYELIIKQLKTAKLI